MKKSIEELIISVFNPIHKEMTVKQIYQAIRARRNSIKYIQVEVAIRSNLFQKKPLFKRVKKGIYCLMDEKASPVIKSIIPNKVENSNELRVEEHLGYLNGAAIRLANEFHQDPQEMYSEIISIAYDYKHLYDFNKGKPTTFLLANVVSRLRNKIVREYIPNIFKMETVSKPGEKHKKVAKRKFLSIVSLSKQSPDEQNIELIDSINPEEDIDNVYDIELRPDKSYEIRDFNNKIKKAFMESGTNERDVMIVSKRFGLDGEQEMTLEDIGIDEGITREAARQVIKKVINRLKKKSNFIELKRMIV